MKSIPDITQAFIDKQYLVPNGPADILLDPRALSMFLIEHELHKSFMDQDKLKTAYFRDADSVNSDSKSCVIEFNEGKILKSASIQVMFDSFFREEHLCPIRIAQDKGEYELLLAPMSQQNIEHLDHFYQNYRINIARAYRVRKNTLHLAFKSGDLPNCLATMFIEQNTVYEEDESRIEGITVSDEPFNPNATIMTASTDELMKLFTK